MTKIRTTVLLPEEDVKLIKILAATHGLTMSDVIVKSVRKAGDLIEVNAIKTKKVGWRSVVGSLKLGGKEPPSRQEMYDRYLREKLSR